MAASNASRNIASPSREASEDGRWQRLRQWLGRPRVRRVLLAIAVILLAMRILLPFVVLSVINRMLDRPGTYQGRAGDVSLSLWRGAYTVHGLQLTARREEEGAVRRDPILDVDRIVIAVSCRELLRGRLVGRIDVHAPVLFLTPPPGQKAPEVPAPDPVAEADRTGPASADRSAAERWQDKVQDLAAMRIDEFAIHDGRIQYRDPQRGFTAELSRIQGGIDGLVVGEGSADWRTSYWFAGETLGGGHLRVEGDAVPLAKLPTLRVRATLESLRLAELNPIARHFGNLSFASGTFAGYLQMEVQEGRIGGEFKPLFWDLQLTTFRDEEGRGASKLFWKIVVPVAEYVLENDDARQHAARIPLKGTVEDPGTSIWTIIGSSLRNAFIEALLPGFGKS